MKPGKWTTMYDDSGTFKECRKVGDRQYQVIEVLDLYEWMGERDTDESGDRWSGDLSFIDINEVPEKKMESAKRSCGWDNMDMHHDESIVEMLHSYGCKAPIGDCRDTTERKCKHSMRHEAMEALTDLEDRLEKTVNKIGSTAREFMQGNIMGGLRRSVEAGQPEARLMAKMYGVDEYAIDDVRPDDWMPYWIGYLDGIHGGEPMKDEPKGSISPEYFRGYERAKRVVKGECPAPGWIRQQKLESLLPPG